MRICVQFADVSAKPLADDPCIDPGFAPGRGRGGGLARFSKGFRQECREQDGTAGSEQGLLQNALQLPDVARPAITAQALQRLSRELACVPPQLKAIAPKVALHQDSKVVASIA